MKDPYHHSDTKASTSPDRDEPIIDSSLGQLPNNTITIAAKMLVPELLRVTSPSATELSKHQWQERDLMLNLHQKVVNAGFEYLGFIWLRGIVHNSLTKMMAYRHPDNHVLASLLEHGQLPGHPYISTSIELSHAFPKDEVERHIIVWDSASHYPESNPPNTTVETAITPTINDMMKQLSHLKSDKRPCAITAENLFTLLQQSITQGFDWLMSLELNLDHLAIERHLFKQLSIEPNETNLKQFKETYFRLRTLLQEERVCADHCQEAQLIDLQTALGI